MDTKCDSKIWIAAEISKEKEGEEIMPQFKMKINEELGTILANFAIEVGYNAPKTKFNKSLCKHRREILKVFEKREK